MTPASQVEPRRAAAPRPAGGRTSPQFESIPRAGQRMTEIVLFLTLFVAYGYFNQGGGWNQNGRFDQVRAIVESGHLFINGYASYQLRADAAGGVELVRRPLPDFARRGARLNTGDWSYNVDTGRYYPNKPPGTSFRGGRNRA